MGTRLALVLAIVMGFIAFIGVKSMVREKEKAIDETAQPVNILAAKTRLLAKPTDGNAAILSEKNVTGVTVQAKYVVTGMIPYSDRFRYFGKVIKRDIDQDKPIFEDALENSSAKVSVSRAVVLEDKRAVTIGVDQIKGVAGLIKPGDYVDVVGTFAVDDVALKQSAKSAGAAPAGWKGANNAGRVTKTIYILQAVPVISVDNRTIEIDYSDARKTPYRSVTLQVSPDDALRLIDATDKGKVQLILRNRTDVKVIEKYNDKATNQPRLSVDITNEIYKTTSKEQ